MSQATNMKPPAWALRFLRYFLKEEYIEEIEGDMEELFFDHLSKAGLISAQSASIFWK